MDTPIKNTGIVQEWLDGIAGFPLWEFVRRMVQIGKRVRSILVPGGIYEVLDYESTLELKDAQGVEAVFGKRENVRYLQNNIIAYQDQAWGDGEILLDYRAVPGKAVDFYRPGRKTYILISIQNVRNFGDQDEFWIEWGMRNCFLRPKELWETAVDHPTRRLRINLIFPAARPPLRIWLIEDARRRGTILSDENLSQSLDGRWRVHWETSQPRQGERYILQWEW